MNIEEALEILIDKVVTLDNELKTLQTQVQSNQGTVKDLSTLVQSGIPYEVALKVLNINVQLEDTKLIDLLERVLNENPNTKETVQDTDTRI